MKYSARCVTCSRIIEPRPGALTCPTCGPFEGVLDILYPLEALRKNFPADLAQLKQKPVFESFAPILPFGDVANMPPVPVGDTPLLSSPNLSKYTGITHLRIKDDTRNPSASLKDRASAVALTMAREAGARVIAAASTGNAASSLATLAASVSLNAVVFVPRNAPRPKLAQILIHGARVIRLNCNYDAAFDLCQMACNAFGWYNRNTAVNPFTGEGKKTVVLEIVRDMDGTPDAIICPVGDGCIIGGIHKGLSDLKGLGFINKLPRLFGIQAVGASPLVKAFETNSTVEPVKEVKTIADSISVGHPRDGVKTLRAVRESAGAMVAVSDQEILEAQKMLASLGGIFAEPAASASLAGLTKLVQRKLVDRHETVVILVTGHGLKDIETAFKNVVRDEELVEPNLDAVAGRVQDLLEH